MKRLPPDFFEFRERILPARSRASVEGAPPGVAALSVSELTARIDRVIKSGFSDLVLVRGEISNFSVHAASGHYYFTLKDAQSCLECVMWKSDVVRVKFTPRGGMELLAAGRLGVYGKKGRYQLYATTLRPVGQGALELAFQQIKARLESKGLFAPERKKPIPRFPSSIVIITSREAAALQDLLKVLRRYPWVQLRLYATPVQGEQAAPKIAAALRHLNSLPTEDRSELILLCRGGGSLEDLWAFNEEVVARAIAGSSIPVVTGIGHEVDVSIADLVADYHAHTPTEAAQVAITHWRTAVETIQTRGLRLHRALLALTRTARQRLSAIERHETFRRPLDRLRQLQQQLDDRQRSLELTARQRLRDSANRLSNLEQLLSVTLSRRLRRSRERCTMLAERLVERHPRPMIQLQRQNAIALSGRLSRTVGELHRRLADHLDAGEARLRALSPEAVLRRGYSITSLKRDGKIVRSASEVRVGDRIVTRLADGDLQSVVQDARQLSLFE